MKFFFALVSLGWICATDLLAVEANKNGLLSAEVDLMAIRDPSTLETHVIQDWTLAAKDNSVRQKLVEITVCEWWPGQKVRLPVTLNVPAEGGPCQNVIVANMGLGLKPALPTGSMLRLLQEKKVGIVLVGMGTIDAMEPAGKLHLGMKENLLKTKDLRFTQAWIWGMSDMRGLTAAIAEKKYFQPVRVLATGGSKRGVGAAMSGIFDSRFTAILPVVAPPIGNPGGAYVLGTDPVEVIEANERFLENLLQGNPRKLPATAHEALIDRQKRRANERLTLDEVRAARWSEAEIAAVNDRAWDTCRVTDYLPALRQRRLDIFYNVGTNDNVCPTLVELGQRFPDFPIYIIPGGQHGGPKDSGFTHQVPSLDEVDQNLHSFASQHFFGSRSMISPPKIESTWDPEKLRLRITVKFAGEIEPGQNRLSWSFDRQAPYTLAYEYDVWQSSELSRIGPSTYSGEIPWTDGIHRVEVVSTHTHVINDLPIAISSPLIRFEPPK